MTIEIIIEIILLGIALAMDAFVVSVTDGLTYTDINKKKSFFIALTFGLMQGIMPLIGYWIVELVEFIAGSAAGEQAGKAMSNIVVWVSFVLLMFIGIKMLVEAIKELNKTNDEKIPKLFSYKEVIYFGFVTAIDALGSGVALHAGLSNNKTIWLHILIIIIITFVISLIGVLFGNRIEKLFKGKFEITGIISGIILILLGIWIILSHYLGI